MIKLISSCKGFGRCTLEAHERSLFWTDVSIFVSREWNRCSEAEDRLWIHSTRKMSFETKLLFSLTMRKTAPSDSGCLQGLQCTGDETVLCWKGCRWTVWRCRAGDRKSVGGAASRKKSLCLTGTAANRLHSAHRDTVSHEYKYHSESHSILGVQYDLTSVLWIIYSINMLNNVCW